MLYLNIFQVILKLFSCQYDFRQRYDELFDSFNFDNFMTVQHAHYYLLQDLRDLIQENKHVRKLRDECIMHSNSSVDKHIAHNFRKYYIL